MKPAQYKAAREALGWSHRKIADTLGVNRRTPYRWQLEEVADEPAARLLRLLVRLHLTIPRRKFEQLVDELCK